MNDTSSIATAIPYIGGVRREPNRQTAYEILEPATDRLLAYGLEGSVDCVEQAIKAAHASAPQWRRVSQIERSRMLHRLADLVEGEIALAEIEARNVGKAIASVRAEIAHVVSTFRYFASVAGTVGGRASRIGGALDYASYQEPVGVVAQVVPWNYPLLMAAWKLAPVLATGCSTVLKPDLSTPLTAIRLAELVEEAGVPPGVVNVVPADGPVVGSHLVSHPRVSKVAFTGSTSSGSEVMRLAASNVSRITLELGGKGANVVMPDADLDEAVAGAVWGAYSSAGQSCESRSRVILHESLHDDFTERFEAVTRSLAVGDPLDDQTVVGSLISPTHRDRVHGFVRRAVEAGATVVTGGEISDGPGAFYPLTLLRPTENDAEIACEEVFGPVATIETFADEQEAITKANATRYGLMATVWSSSSSTARRLAHALEFGTVAINHPLTTFPGVPFGGVKHSGFGREFSIESLQDYLVTKSVTQWTSSRSSKLITTA